MSNPSRDYKMPKVGFYGGKFLPLHLGHVKCILEAASLCQELHLILFHSLPRDTQLTQKSKIGFLPYHLRLRWLRQLTSHLPHVIVHHLEDDATTDALYDWHKGTARVKKAISKPIDIVFGSEPGYTPMFNQYYKKAKYHLIDPQRADFRISATQIRNEGVYAHWNFIPQVVKPYFTKKVLITGTESCGKSTIVQNLATIFNTNFVPEYGRTMCEWAGGADEVLTPDLYLQIAYGHKQLEFESIQHANQVLFIDTDAVVTHYYLKLYQKSQEPLLKLLSENQHYDAIFMLRPDTPWIEDGLRFHGETKLRQKNHQLLLSMYHDLHMNVVEVSGNYHQKLTCITNQVKKLLY